MAHLLAPTSVDAATTGQDVLTATNGRAALDMAPPGVTMRVLICGGAGFIGSHLCDILLAEGHEVMAYDILVPQVHGGEGLQARKAGDVPPWPTYMDPRVQSWIGDVGNTAEVLRALDKFQPEVVVHLAAYVGVAQSWSHPAAYLYGGPVITASLYEAIRAHNAGDGSATPVRRVFVAGSMSSYGEGLVVGGQHCPVLEDDPLDPRNPYALSKAGAEQVALMLGAQMGIETVVGRFFNVLGSRQALGNPYTGVVAMWAAALLAGQAPVVFEDGEQSRDFIHVSDVVRGIWTIVESGEAGEVYNVGRGERVRILDVAKGLCERHGGGIAPTLPGIRRAGDIRHCFADADKLRTLGWMPKVSLDEAIDEQWAWAQEQLADAEVGAAGFRQSLKEAALARGLSPSVSPVQGVADDPTGPVQSSSSTVVDDGEDS